MSDTISKILEGIGPNRESLRSVREILLANAMMIGEIPSPTNDEAERITFLSNRFTEEGLQNISIDEAGNGMAVLPGTVGDRNILVCAHSDTVFDSGTDHAMRVTSDRIAGPGISDNSLGLAAVATLPEILRRLNLQFKDNLILLCATKSLGHGNLEGMRFFLNHFKQPIHAGICVEGVQLGRLSYSAIGMLRGVIKVSVPSEYDWTRFGASNAVAIMSSIVQQILRIPIPAEPKTKIIFGSMRAGTSFSTNPTSAILRFEIRSEEVGMVGKLRSQIEDITEETANATNTDIKLSVIAQRKTGGLPYGHPMIKAMRKILSELSIKPHVEPSVGELSEMIYKGIPSVTIGLTKGSHKNETNESIEIEPAFAGLSQLVALLSAIDGGFCDE